MSTQTKTTRDAVIEDDAFETLLFVVVALRHTIRVVFQPRNYLCEGTRRTQSCASYRRISRRSHAMSYASSWLCFGLKK